MNDAFNRWLNPQVRRPDGTLDLDRLYEVAARYGFDKREDYARLNPGQQRMNVGNLLRNYFQSGEGTPHFEAPDPGVRVSPTPGEATAEEGPRFEDVAPLINAARGIAIAYKRLTGRPLGVTGEVGEYEAARLLGYELAPVRSPGYDLVDPDTGRTFQVKARCIGPRAKSGQRLGAIRRDSSFDALLLVILDEDLMPLSIWEAGREAVMTALMAPGSRARNERGALGVAKFKSIARQVWPGD